MDDLFRVGDDAAGVAAARVEENGNFEQAILTVDHGRPGNLANVRNLPKGDLRPARARYQDIRDFIRVAPKFRRVAYAHGKTPPPFDSSGDVVFTDGGFNHVLDGADIDAVTGGSLAICPDVEIESAGHLFGIDITRAFHRSYHVGDLARLSFEHR